MEEKIRKIITYHGDEGTSGYLLSQAQINQILELVSQSKKDVIELVENKRKSVGDLFPNYKHEPTEEFAMQVQAKEYYNKALDDILLSLKDKEDK